METPTQTALILSAQAGDRTAFDTLVEPYQRELLVHCYRMLGSVHDAEDLVQETLIRAWEKRATFTSPGSYRAWLYRIATNLCLNVLSRNPRRILPSSRYPATDPSLPLPKDVREPIWLEPFPDELLAGPYTDPEAHTLLHERITLAFLVAIQHLTPTQRAILLLREVLEWDARETAEWLNLSVPAVNSALQRARRTLLHLHASPPVPFAPSSAQIQSLLDRFVALWEQGDIPGLVALLREDARFSMPPIPAWFQGRAAITTFFQTTTFTYPGKWRLLPTYANASPAFGVYRWHAEAGVYQLFGLLVLEMMGEQVAHMVAFLELSSLLPFALPDTLLPSQERPILVVKRAEENGPFPKHLLRQS
jgi:RNA polymerase sigma-70 factor, ECF subfamily